MSRFAVLWAPCLSAVFACTGAEPARSPEHAAIRLTDDTGHEIALVDPARRIVSLVPAATEIVFALRGGDRVVGRTRFDTHPPEVTAIPSVGDGIRPDPEAVLARRPDLVVMFAGPDNRGSIERFRELGLATLAIRHNDLADLRRNIDRLGSVIGADVAADSLVREIDESLDRLARRAAADEPVRVYYHLGGDPPYTIGAGSYLDSLLTIAGGRNIFRELTAPSARVGLEAIVAHDPGCIVIGTGETPRAARASLDGAGWSAIEAVRRGRIVAIDHDLIHRLGPRVGVAAESLSAAIGQCRADRAGI